jgi:hypothetical protein
MADQPEKLAPKLEHALNVVLEFVQRRTLPRLPELIVRALLDAAKDDIEYQLTPDPEAAAKAELGAWLVANPGFYIDPNVTGADADGMFLVWLDSCEDNVDGFGGEGPTQTEAIRSALARAKEQTGG